MTTRRARGRGRVQRPGEPRPSVTVTGRVLLPEVRPARPLDDVRWWEAAADGLRWRVARTMPECPHSYIVRGEQLGEEDFERAVLTIRRHGEPGKYEGRTAVYLTDTLGKYKYWTMGAALERTTVINRADATLTYGVQDAPATASPDALGRVASTYTEVAPHYDARYTGPECRDENIALWRTFVAEVPRSRPRVLDVGAGTGLALDLGLTKPEAYRALDPSQGMLNELVRKYPSVTDVWACSVQTYRDLVEQVRAGESLGPVGSTRDDPDAFDVATALFSSSYLSPEELRWTAFEAAPVSIMIHCVPGYLPDYDETDPETRAEVERIHAASWEEMSKIIQDCERGRENASVKSTYFGAARQYLLVVVRQLPEVYRARMTALHARPRASA